MLIIFKNLMTLAKSRTLKIVVVVAADITVSEQKKLKSEIKLNHSRTNIIQVTLNNK